MKCLSVSSLLLLCWSLDELLTLLPQLNELIQGFRPANFYVSIMSDIWDFKKQVYSPMNSLETVLRIKKTDAGQEIQKQVYSPMNS